MLDNLAPQTELSVVILGQVAVVYVRVREHTNVCGSVHI